MELTSRGKSRIKFLLVFTPGRRVSPGHLRSQPNLKLFLGNSKFHKNNLIHKFLAKQSKTGATKKKDDAGLRFLCD